MKVPEYFEEFKCIGGVCSDSCCTGWDIDIDKKSFREYHKTKNVQMKKMFQKYVHNNEYCTDDNIDYGRIKLPADKRCPFLDEENYCVIFKNLGEEYLSCVCTHFPRVLNKVDNNFELSLDIACPEAARIILNIEEGIKFKDINKTLNKFIVSMDVNTKDKEFKNCLISKLKELRAKSIEIIQNRKYSLSERIFALGYFINNVDELGEVSINKAANYINSFDIKDAIKQYEFDSSNYVMQVSFFKSIVDQLNIVNEIDNVSFKKYTKDILEGYNLNSDEDLKNNMTKYVNTYIEYCDKYMDKYEYIFENYLVNTMYNNLFPFSESDNIFDGFIMLLFMYSFMRFYLVGRYLFNKKDSKDEIIHFVQNFVKAIEHDKNYRIEILEYIKENELDNFEFSKVLL